MKHTLTSKAAELMRKNGRHRRWRRAFSGMAAVVVFITTYMLILPAITMENQAICGMAEHTHTDACYEMQLVCTQEETPEGADVHVHGPECYEQQQVLTCTKQEGEGHTHTDACYGYVCGQEESAGHTHTDACYTEVTHRELTCTEPESAGHTHGDGCYDEEGNLVCTEAESTGHTHGDSCYTETVTRELTCGQEESSGHTHTDACIGLICGQEEYEGHTHTDACYTTEDVLVCTEPTGHTHGDGCYEKVLVCDVPEHTHTEECYPAAEPEEPQEPELICTLPEHSHEDACYDADGNLICGMEEHTHTEECYAPVEIPEEETPTTAFPEEIPEGYVEYTFDNEAGLTVTAYAPEGAFGQDVQLFAEVLSEDSEEYAQAKENLDKAENAPEYTGMAAMDIRFVDAAAEDPAQAEEIEPDAEMGQVFVKIDAQALIPEDVDESTLAVQHHAKVSDGGIFGTGIFEHTDVVVETVADNTEETGDITAVPDETALPETLPALADEPEMAEAATLEEPAAETEETQPVAMNVEAEFAVNSFSTFTITWGSGYSSGSVTVHYVDERGTEITGSQTSRVEKNKGNWVDLKQYSKEIENYTFSGYYYGSTFENKQKMADASASVIQVRYITDYYGSYYYRTQNNGYGTYMQFDEYYNRNIYLVYKGTYNIPTIKTVDSASAGITINLFDYQRNGGVGEFALGDGKGWTGGGRGVRQDVVKPSLEDGFPVVNVSGGKNLRGLFGTDLEIGDEFKADYNNEGNNVTITDVRTNLNNLFYIDEDGYYYYNSAENFASLQDDGNFKVYAVPVGSSGVEAAYPKFIPFMDLQQKAPLVQDGNTYYYLEGLNVCTGTNSNDDFIKAVDLHFGMNIDFEFLMPKDGKIEGANGEKQNMVFEFAGDDDVWVFIDGALVLDMGGIHDNYNGSINFATGDVYVEKVYSTDGDKENQHYDLGDLMAEAKDWEWVRANMHELPGGNWVFNDYTTHEFDFFYLERGWYGSNCKIKFNLPALQKNSLNVSKTLEAVDGASEEINQYLNNLEYKFRVLKDDALPSTTNPSNLFITPETNFDIYKNNVDTGRDGTVAPDGTFVIKANETAVFTNISENAGRYYVQEIVEEEYSEQFGGVEVNVKPEGGTSYGEENGVTIDDQKFVGMISGSVDASATGFVNFTNKVDIKELSLLRITKDAANGSSFGDDEEFTIRVTMGGEDVPAGTIYQLYEDGSDIATTGTVSDSGEITLKPGQTVAFRVLTGTEYTVSEVNGSTYHVGYTATQTIGQTTWTSDDDYTLIVTSPESGDAVASGVVGQAIGDITDTTNATVEVTITNQSYDFNTFVNVSKTLTGYSAGTYEFTFNVEQVKGVGDHTAATNKVGTPVGATLTVNSSNEVLGAVYFGFKNNESSGTYYYKVSEQKGTDATISYDESYYIVEVKVEAGTPKTASVTDVTKYSKSGSLETFPWSSGTALPFTNSLTGSLSISKVVARTDSQKAAGTGFSFTVDLKNSGFNETVTATVKTMAVDATTGAPVLADRNYTYTGGTTTKEVKFDKGIAIITLNHGETIVIPGLPAANSAEITETTTAGYSTKWTGDTYPDRNEVVGATVTTAQISTNPAVTCTNTTGAVLPSTGGMGTTPFLALGTLLTLGAGMLLVQRRRKEGSDAV